MTRTVSILIACTLTAACGDAADEKPVLPEPSGPPVVQQADQAAEANSSTD